MSLSLFRSSRSLLSDLIRTSICAVSNVTCRSFGLFLTSIFLVGNSNSLLPAGRILTVTHTSSLESLVSFTLSGRRFVRLIFFSTSLDSPEISILSSGIVITLLLSARLSRPSALPATLIVSGTVLTAPT